MEQSKLRVGIVGLGYWGPKIVEIFKNLGVLEVICDRREDLLAEVSAKSGVRGVTDFSKMLGEIDAVVITTPPVTHYMLAKEALEKGKHVFVEKPLTTSAKEAEELTEIAKKQGKILFVDHTFCYDGILRKLRERINAGEFGKVKSSGFEWLGARQKQEGPDVLWDSGPHAYATLYFLLGKIPLKISAVKLLSLDTGVLSALSAKASFADGSSAKILLAWQNQKLFGKDVEKAARVVLDCEKKQVDFEGSFATRQASIVNSNKAGEVEIILPKSGDNPLKSACQEFLDSIIFDKPAASSGEFGAVIVRILEATERSLESGKPADIS